MAGQDCAGLDMLKKYALIKHGIVQSTFYSESGPEAYPDIADHLMEVEESVKDNYRLVAGAFFAPEIFQEQPPEPESSSPWWKFW